ncbi:MAG: hypothetical protein QXW00_03610 [Candidatus Woesearchaeota archaeon]
MSTLAFDIIGFLGMATILIAFLLNQKGIWNSTSLKYDLSNLAGAIMLMIYASHLKSYPFLILNCIWALASLKDVITDIADGKNYKPKLGHKAK